MNFVVISGRLTRDPETRHTQSGAVTTSFTLALDKQLSKDKKAELQSRGYPTADFPRIVTWGRVAEIASEHLTKGRKVLIEGSLQTGQYKDNNGGIRYTTDIIASKIEFMDPGSKQENKDRDYDPGFGPDFSGQSFDDEVPF